MKELYKTPKSGRKKLTLEEGQREVLYSNKTPLRCPPSGFNPNSPLVSKEMAIEHLARLIVRSFMEKKERERKQKGSDILPGLN
jgi:hypothetical protein